MKHALTTGTLPAIPKALARRKRTAVGGPFHGQEVDMHVEASRTSTIRAQGYYGFYQVNHTTLTWVSL